MALVCTSLVCLICASVSVAPVTGCPRSCHWPVQLCSSRHVESANDTVSQSWNYSSMQTIRDWYVDGIAPTPMPTPTPHRPGMLLFQFTESLSSVWTSLLHSIIQSLSFRLSTVKPNVTDTCTCWKLKLGQFESLGLLVNDVCQRIIVLTKFCLCPLHTGFSVCVFNLFNCPLYTGFPVEM